MTNTIGPLLNSVFWNLREISKLCKTIQQHSGPVECESWRFPTKSCNDLNVSELLCMYGTETERYTLALELIYDFVIYMVRLIMQYLENNKSLSEEYAKPQNVRRPANLSLAACMSILWARLQNYSKVASSEYIAGKTACLDEVSHYVQTDLSCTSKCASCSNAQELFTYLVLEIEKLYEADGGESAILQEREKMKGALVELSSWSVMTRWISAIIQDFQNIMQKVHRNRKRRATVSRVRAQREAEHKNSVQERDAKIDKLKNTISQLEKENTVATTSLHALQVRSEEQLAMQIKQDDKSRVLRQSIAEWERRYLDEIDKGKHLQRNLEKHSMLLQEGKRKEAVTEAESRRAAEQVKQLTEENKRLCEINLERQNIISTLEDKLLSTYPPLHGAKKLYKGTGNPFIDMQNQMEANQLRIQQLREENEKLTVTIGKMKALTIK